MRIQLTIPTAALVFLIFAQISHAADSPNPPNGNSETKASEKSSDTSTNQEKEKPKAPLAVNEQGMKLIEASEQPTPAWINDPDGADDETFFAIGKGNHLKTLYAAQVESMEEAVRKILRRAFKRDRKATMTTEWITDAEGKQSIRLIAHVTIGKGTWDLEGFDLQNVYYELWEAGNQKVFVSWVRVTWKRSVFDKVMLDSSI